MWTITKDQKDHLMREIYLDKSWVRIARNVGIGVATVKRYAKELGIKHTYGGRLKKDVFYITEVRS